MFFFEIAVFGFLGLILGSFSTAIYYREVINKPWWSFNKKDKYYKSLCPSCEHTLCSWDLIPVLSYLMQKGRCRYCSGYISKRYLIIELLCFISSISVYLLVGFNVSAFLYAASLPFAISILGLWAFNRVFSLKLFIIFTMLTIVASILLSV